MSQDLEGIKEITTPTPSFYRWENRETGGQERSQDYSVLEAQLRLMCWSPNSGSLKNISEYTRGTQGSLLETQ